MEAKNYYEILGVNENASQDDIKKAYKSLARKWHPDLFTDKSEKEQNEANIKSKEINEAYDTLKDEEKRRMYDMQRNGSGFEDVDLGDLFSHFRGNPFGGNPFGGNPFSQQVRVGEDDRIEVFVTLEEVLKGGNRKVPHKNTSTCHHCNGTGSADGKPSKCTHCNGTGMFTKRMQTSRGVSMVSTPCPHCHGTGEMPIVNKCKHCNGTGFLTENGNIDIVIPKGIFDGAAIQMSGKGFPPKGGNGRNGDLYVIFNVQPHSNFSRNGDDLTTEVSLNLQEALIGCNKDITCLDGSKTKIKIPNLTKDGQTYRIKGKGLPNINYSNKVGDLLVKVKYVLPKNINSEQEKLLKKFYEIENSK